MLNSWSFTYSLLVSLVVVFVLVPSVTIAQTTHYVDADATGDNDGTSWTDAYTDLQDALAAAGSGDQIWIAEGVYYPDEGTGVTSGDSDASFVIEGSQDGLEIYGGFDSGDTFDERDWDGKPVVLSGDIGDDDSNNTPSGVTPTADDIVGTNSDHVVILDGGDGIGEDVGGNITSSTVLDGVIITGGRTSSIAVPESNGGGLYCDGQGSGNECSPQITSVKFKGNAAILGGAILNNGSDSGTSSPQITSTTFSGNSMRGFGGQGAAIFNDGSNGTSNPQISYSIFEENSALESGHGGAITNSNSSPQISRVHFKNNHASNGGAISEGRNSDTQLNRVVFAHNSANKDGGAIEGGLRATNALFVENTAENGGAIASYNEGLNIINATFYGNSANSDGGAILNGSNNTQITNTILWKNVASGSGDEIHNYEGSPTVSHTIIEGGIEGISENRGSSTIDGGGNMEADPLFVDANDPSGGTFATGDDGLQVTDGSPALDAGTNSALDLDGDGTRDVVNDIYFIFGSRSRVIKNDPNATTATVDIGAYEAPESTVLPVELAVFGIRERSKSALLTWQTASEKNNAGFEVQRRATNEWKTLSFIEGKGTTSETQTYRYRDTDLPYEAESVAYRLKQIDTDGTTTFSETRTLTLGAPNKVALHAPFPNPAQAHVTLRYALPNKTDVSIRVYDVLGRRVATLQHGSEDAGRKEVQISTSDLSPGTYLVRMQAGEKLKTRQLTVVK
jgi:predicted outer membrane repeat protein